MSTKQWMQKIPEPKNGLRLIVAVQCGDSGLLLLRAGLIGSWPGQLKIFVPELVFNQE